MASLTRAYKPNILRLSFIKKFDEAIEKILPRPCMVVSVGLILSGLVIPLFMVIGVLPVCLWLGFIGFSLVLTGGVLALTFCGEI